MSQVRVSLKRDFKHIQWLPTLQIMLVRAIGASLVFLLLIIVVGGAQSIGGTENINPMFIIMLFGVITFAAMFVYPLVGLVGWGLLSIFIKIEENNPRFITPDNAIYFAPFILIGMLSYVGTTLFVMMGDPLTFALHKFKPDWIPVERYGIVNFVPIMLVLDPDHMNRLQMSNKTG